MGWRDRAKPVEASPEDHQEPKPEGSWRDRAKAVEPDKIDAYAMKGASLLRKAGAKGLEYVGKVGRAVDSVTGAPVRQAVGALQEGAGLGDALSAAKAQFAEDPSKAPSGKDLASRAGLSTDDSINTGIVLNPWTQDKLHVSPAGLAGAGLEAVTDPTTYIPGRVVAKGVQMGVKGMEHVAPPVARALEHAADWRAFKAASGQNKKAFKTLTKTGQLDNVGRAMRTADEAGPAVVGAFSRAEDVLPRAEAKLKYYKDKIKEVSDAIDTHAPGSIDGQNIAANLEKWGADNLTDAPEDAPLRARLAQDVEFYRGRGKMNFADAQSYKNRYKWDAKDNNAQQDLKNAMKRAVGGEMNEAATRLGKSLSAENVVGQELKDEVRAAQAKRVNAAPDGVDDVELGPVIDLPGIQSRRVGPSAERFDISGSQQVGMDAEKREQLKALLDKYGAYKKGYGVNKTAADVSRERVLSNQSNRFASPSDYGTGLMTAAATAMAGGGPSLVSLMTGAAAAGANKVARTRGSAMASKAAASAAAVIDAAPEKFAKWLPVLQQGAKRGGEGFAITHHLLMNNDPEYKALVEGRK